MSKKTKPSVLDISVLEKMSTKELLGYLNRLHRCEESFESSDITENPDISNTLTIYFKQSHKWKEAFRKVKTILSKREHID